MNKAQMAEFAEATASKVAEMSRKAIESDPALAPVIIAQLQLMRTMAQVKAMMRVLTPEQRAKVVEIGRFIEGESEVFLKDLSKA